MNFVSARIITDDVARLASFYERVTGLPADRPVPDFAEVRTASGTVAIGSTRTVAAFAPGSAEPAANRSVTIEFLVDDVDAVYTRLTAADGAQRIDIVAPPKDMPWGNRALVTRDPDGNLVNFFTPVSADARAKYAGVPR